MNFDTFKKELLAGLSPEEPEFIKPVSSHEIFTWEAQFHVTFPAIFKSYLNEFGTFGFDHSFYDCLNNPEYYQIFPNKDFINLLLDEGFAPKEIRYADYNFKTDHFVSPAGVHNIYESLNRDKDCFDTGVCLFDDTYNCNHFLMLSGKFENYLAEEVVIRIGEHDFRGYKPLKLFYDPETKLRIPGFRQNL